MARKHNYALTDLARSLRKNMTKEERHLWYDFLRSYRIPFQRQKTMGDYIVDFYCPSAKLVIELDGSQHYEAENQFDDQQRTLSLESMGLKILRFANNEVNQNFSGVCQAIDMACTQRLPCAKGGPGQLLLTLRVN